MLSTGVGAGRMAFRERVFQLAVLTVATFAPYAMAHTNSAVNRGTYEPLGWAPSSDESPRTANALKSQQEERKQKMHRYVESQLPMLPPAFYQFLHKADGVCEIFSKSQMLELMMNVLMCLQS